MIWRRLFISTALLLAIGAPAAAERPYNPGYEGLTLGVETYQPGGGDYASWTYPTLGYTVDQRLFYMEMQSILAVRGLDSVVGYFRSPSRGQHVISGVFNREEPGGRQQVMSMSLRRTVALRSGWKLDIGGSYGWDWISRSFAPALTEDEIQEIPGAFNGPLTLQFVMHQVGASAGLGFRTARLHGNVGLTLGNGFSPVSFITPFGNLSTTLRFIVKDRLGLFLRAGITHQRFDYTNHTLLTPVSRQVYDVNVVDRLTFAEAQFGVVFALYPARGW